MLTQTQETSRVLAVSPISRGFGYVVMESAERLVDWGVKESKESTLAHSLRQIKTLVVRYQPTAILVEDFEAGGSRRRGRGRKLVERLLQFPFARIYVRKVSRHLVRLAFAGTGAVTRHDIAQALARTLPELSWRLPPPRRTGMNQDARLSLFDAAALARTYYHFAPAGKVR